MLAIPLPFVMSLLLIMIVFLLKEKQPIEGRLPSLFIILCAVSTAVVGLRWTFDISVIRFIQPIIASLLPVGAWYCFAKAHRSETVSKNSYLLHSIGPIAIGLSSFWYQMWLDTTDVLLVLLNVAYGVILIRSSFNMPEDVRLTQVPRLIRAERVAGIVLLISASIDAAISFDFILNGGVHVSFMLSLSYLVLIPVVVAAVLTVGLSTFHVKQEKHEREAEVEICSGSSQPLDSNITESRSARLTDLEANDILSKINKLMIDKESFRDPDLTLNRLSRKLGIPTRQVSIAVNQACQQNISKVLNEYRINFAKIQLVSSQDTITDIYLASGFQTKSNFNREFLRITGQSPSEFRRTHVGTNA